MFRRFISYLLIMLSITTLLNVSVLAMDEIGSITIDVIHQEDINGNRIDTTIPNVGFKVYQVWTYDISDPENIKIIYSPGFENIVDINLDMSEDEIQKTAPKFVEAAKDSVNLLSTNLSDSNGRIVINNLKIGAYLFINDDVIEHDGALYKIMPFLITVPRKINDKYVYDVKALPKLSIVKDEPPLDKTVNGEKQYQLKVDYEVFTYTIKSNMPLLADEFEIYDTLEPVLEFGPYESLDELIDVTIGSNKLSLEELKKQVKIEGQQLTVSFTVEQLKEYKEKEVVINFKARIKKDADLSKYIEKKVPNDCEYKLNNIFKKSDKVYVTPPPPPWNPPKTGILIIDTIVGNPIYLISFVSLVLFFIFMTLRRYRRQSY